jgi:hypothetical protein
LARWFSPRVLTTSYGQANENRAPFSSYFLFPIYTHTLVFQLAVYSAWHLLTCWFLLKLFLRHWRWRRYVPPKRRLQLNKLHGVTSQKMILFKNQKPLKALQHNINGLKKRHFMPYMATT